MWQGITWYQGLKPLMILILRTHTHSLTPSLSLSLPPSLSHSLSPSLMHRSLSLLTRRPTVGEGYSRLVRRLAPRLSLLHPLSLPSSQSHQHHLPSPPLTSPQTPPPATRWPHPLQHTPRQPAEKSVQKVKTNVIIGCLATVFFVTTVFVSSAQQLHVFFMTTDSAD